MIGKNEPTGELNLEILFCVDIFSPVSILEPLFLGISTDTGAHRTRKYLEASNQIYGKALSFYLAGTFSVW